MGIKDSPDADKSASKANENFMVDGQAAREIEVESVLL